MISILKKKKKRKKTAEVEYSVVAATRECQTLCYPDDQATLLPDG